MTIRIRSNLRKKRLSTAAIEARLAKLLRTLGIPEAEVSVLFIGDRAMRTLNKRYRGRDASTDVLSFPFREGPFSDIQPGMLGDIVISEPAAVRQALWWGHTRDREIDRLLVHGLVHLLGYDHERGPRDALRMERKERKLLAVLAS